MEKIQQALERAREERRLALDSSGLAEFPTSGRVTDRAPDGRTAELRAAVTLPATMRRHRLVAASAEAGNSKAHDMAAEAFRVLRGQVLQRLDAISGRALAITSPHDRDGKTLVALNLAVTLAKLGERSAILVDADFRRPAVHRYLGIQPTQDVSDFLQGTAALDDCLLRLDVEDLLVLPQAKPIRRSSELLASTRMRSLVAELKRRFPNRVIIFDCPPLIATEDPLIIQRHTDGCLLVVREGTTTKADLRRAAELLGEERYLGAVLNNARWQSLPGYYY